MIDSPLFIGNSEVTRITKESLHETHSLPTGVQYKRPAAPAAPPRKPVIHILGDQSALGISRNLSGLRKNKWNDVYGVSSLVKPFALSSEILKDFKGLITQVSAEDLIILMLGSNDRSSIFISQLEDILLKNTKNNVFICEIRQNSYLDVKKVNEEIRSIVLRIRNCHFLELKTGISIIKQLNIEIDYLRYEKDFIINFGKQYRTKNAQQTPKGFKVGTIPYFFYIQETKNKLKHLEIAAKNPKKGTIPYYFRAKHTSPNSVNATSINPTKSVNFFRE